MLRNHVGAPKGSRPCLGLFTAAAKHEAPFVRGARLHLYAVRHSDDALRRLGLIVADRASADLSPRIPHLSEADFRGARLIDGVLVADLLQVWARPLRPSARGAELAGEIAHHLELGELE